MRLETSNKAAYGGRAEGAALAAADLGGNADGISVLIAHDNGFDRVAVIQLPQVFYRAVNFRDLLAEFLRLVNGIFGFKLLAQRFWDIAHFIN